MEVMKRSGNDDDGDDDENEELHKNK